MNCKHGKDAQDYCGHCRAVSEVPESFVLGLDINNGFTIEKKQGFFDVIQEELNGLDGCNLGMGEAKYAVDKEELLGIVNDIQQKLLPRTKGNMKTYLVTACISDGGYEHYSYALTEKKTIEEALAYAEECKNAFFGWEDREDEVEVTVEKVAEIDPVQAQVLRDTGVCTDVYHCDR